MAPQESIVRELYESHAHPFTRVVHGLPMSWDKSTAATTRPSTIDVVVWSPCNRFIAISREGAMTVDVLDSATLQRLQTLESPQGTSVWHRAVIFSPDSRILTCSSGGSVDSRHQCQELSVVSWDLQTGGVASIIRWKGPPRENVGNTSITFSANGRAVAVFRWYRGKPSTANVFIFDVASGIHMHSHSFDSHTPLMDNIWAHGESLRFATVHTGTITIWEAGFTSGATPTEVETLPAPDGYHDVYGSLRLLPAPCRLALVLERGVLVRDVRNSNHLLHFTGAWFDKRMSFSSDGHFFACSTTGSGIYLWKESPTGYILHRILESSTDCPNPLLSPNGESIVVFGNHTIRLFRTSLITTPSSIPTRAPRRTKDFVLDFSPDGALAAVTVQNGGTVVVLNLKSGVPQLTIDANVRVYGLRVIGNTVVVIGGEKAITWNLPTGDCVPDARVGRKDSSRTRNLRYPLLVGSASISPDSRYIAVMSGEPLLHLLSIYSASTGERVGKEISIAGTTPGTTLWFSPDGCDVWCVRDSSEACRVSGGQDVLELPKLEWRTVDVEGYPWRSSQDFQVTSDWWILGPDGKRLLMLPPPWQSYAVHRVWKGRFLALLHSALSEPVILELNP